MYNPPAPSLTLLKPSPASFSVHSYPCHDVVSETISVAVQTNWQFRRLSKCLFVLRLCWNAHCAWHTAFLKCALCMTHSIPEMCTVWDSQYSWNVHCVWHSIAEMCTVCDSQYPWNVHCVWLTVFLKCALYVTHSISEMCTVCDSHYSWNVQCVWLTILLIQLTSDTAAGCITVVLQKKKNPKVVHGVLCPVDMLPSVRVWQHGNWKTCRVLDVLCVK